jgi:hypothetical protein
MINGSVNESDRTRISFHLKVIHYSPKEILTYIDLNKLLITYRKPETFGQIVELIKHDYREWN